jgi:segregation and condensation protein B
MEKEGKEPNIENNLQEKIKPEKLKDVIVSSETVKELDEDRDIENIKKVEAALFISARFLNLQELVMLTDINPLMIREILEKLIDIYNKEDSAIEIIVKENMWKMDVRQEYVPMINKLATGSAEFTKTEQETLAVIAYKQPVKQSVIIKIRGNKAYDHIKHFIDIGLVISKRAGHTLELKLSDDFFEYFHLQKKEEEGRVVASEEKEDEEGNVIEDYAVEDEGEGNIKTSDEEKEDINPDTNLDENEVKTNEDEGGV